MRLILLAAPLLALATSPSLAQSPKPSVDPLASVRVHLKQAQANHHIMTVSRDTKVDGEAVSHSAQTRAGIDPRPTNYTPAFYQTPKR